MYKQFLELFNDFNKQKIAGNFYDPAGFVSGMLNIPIDLWLSYVRLSNLDNNLNQILVDLKIQEMVFLGQDSTLCPGHNQLQKLIDRY